MRARSTRTSGAAANRGVVLATSLAVLAVLAGGIATGWLAWKQAGLIEELTKARAAEGEHRAEAEAKRQEAERSSKTAWQVVTFVTSSLEVAHPFDQGRDYTVREFLDNAAKGLDRAPIDDPLTEAAIRSVIADMYNGLGRFSDSLIHAERTFKLRSAALPPADRRTIEATELYARSLARSGDATRAMEIIETTLPVALRSLGADDDAVLMFEHDKALALTKLGRFNEAIALARPAFDRARATLGDGNNATVSLANILGNALATTKRTMEARELWEFQLRQNANRYGSNSMAVIVTRASIAALDLSLMRNAEVEAELKDILRQMKQNGNDDTQYSASLRANLAIALNSQKKHEEAEMVAREALAYWEKTGQTNSPEAITDRGILAEILDAAKKHDEAIPMLTQLVADAETSLGVDHQLTLACMNKLSRALTAIGENDRSIAISQDIWDRAIRRHGRVHIEVVEAGERLGTMLNRQKRFAEAVPVLAETLEIAEQLPGLEPVKLIGLRAMCGTVMNQVGQFAEAEKVLLGDEKKPPEHLKDMQPEVQGWYYFTIMNAYQGLRQPEQAASYRALCDEARRTGRGGSSAEHRRSHQRPTRRPDPRSRNTDSQGHAA